MYYLEPLIMLLLCSGGVLLGFALGRLSDNDKE